MANAQSILTALKYGRVLSAANEREITAAVSALVSVLARAGIEIGNDMDEKAIEEKLKQLDPETAQQIVEIVNEFVGQLDAQLGITEATQGEQPPPEEGDNPDEEEPPDEKPEGDQPPPKEDMPEDEGNPKKKPPYRKDRKAYWLSQEEVNYTPDYTGENHCASCRWFIPQGEFGAPSCTIVATWPQPILATGTCDRHEVPPTYEPEPLPVEVVNAAASAGDLFPITTASGASVLLTGIKKLFTRPATPADNGNFQVFKGADGNYHWIARHTNSFEDRDKEILSTKAHDAYIARINMGLIDKPELWAWHTKGSRHGQADMVWRHEQFVFALGHFDDTPEGKRAVKYYQRHQGQIELSHGFTYPSWALHNGVYDTYNTFEISTLPPGAAANPYTAFEEIEAMALSDKQRAWIKDTLGDEGLARVERAQSEAEKDGETLVALDKRYKDFADAVVDDGTDTVKVDLKALLKLNAQLIEAQADQETRIAAVVAESTAIKAENATLRADYTALKVQLDARARSASRADETRVEMKDLPKDVQDSLYEENPIWGKLKPKV